MVQYGFNFFGLMVCFFEYSDYGVKVVVVLVIGVIVFFMEDGFKFYFKDVMKVLGNFVIIKDSDEVMEFCSVICDSFGCIVFVVGGEEFQFYVVDFMIVFEEVFGFDNFCFKEISFLFWSNFFKVYKDEFVYFFLGIFKGFFIFFEFEEEEIDLFGVDFSQLGDGVVVVGGKCVKVKVFGS